MRAAVLDRFGGDVEVRDVPDPAPPGPGEVLITVETCGVGLTLERARTGALGGTKDEVRHAMVLRVLRGSRLLLPCRLPLATRSAW